MSQNFFNKQGNIYVLKATTLAPNTIDEANLPLPAPAIKQLAVTMCQSLNIPLYERQLVYLLGNGQNLHNLEVITYWLSEQELCEPITQSEFQYLHEKLMLKLQAASNGLFSI